MFETIDYQSKLSIIFWWETSLFPAGFVEKQKGVSRLFISLLSYFHLTKHTSFLTSRSFLYPLYFTASNRSVTWWMYLLEIYVDGIGIFFVQTKSSG